MDMMEAWDPSYADLEDYYRRHFSLRFLDTTFENKVGLISLICFLTQQARKKSPDATCYQVIMKIVGNEKFDKYRSEFIRGLSIVCGDMMEHTSNFITFDLKSSKAMVNKVKEILETWIPF